MWLESYWVSESYPDDAAEDADEVREQVGVLHHPNLLVEEPGPRPELEVDELRVGVVHNVLDVQVVLSLRQVCQVVGAPGLNNSLHL